MTQSQIMYPMNLLRTILSEEGIALYSKNYHFDESDEFFHFDHEEQMLESCGEIEIEWHNDGLPVADRLVIYKEKKRK